MRIVTLAILSAGLITACASVPTVETPSELAATKGATPGMIAAAQATDQASLHASQLVNIRNAEARLDLARARLDLASVRNRSAEDGDVREFLAARRALKDARNVYGPTDTGRREISIWSLSRDGTSWPRPERQWLNESEAAPDALNPGSAEPLSGLRP